MGPGLLQYCLQCLEGRHLRHRWRVEASLRRAARRAARRDDVPLHVDVTGVLGYHDGVVLVAAGGRDVIVLHQVGGGPVPDARAVVRGPAVDDVVDHVHGGRVVKLRIPLAAYDEHVVVQRDVRKAGADQGVLDGLGDYRPLDRDIVSALADVEVPVAAPAE